MNTMREASKAVADMEKYLYTLLVADREPQATKLWENTYIKHQIDKRRNSEHFSLSDHIRAMVYSMLSSSLSWEKVEHGIDSTTGRITPIDEIFHQYDPQFLLQTSPQKLADEIKSLHLGSQSTNRQMVALVDINIEKLHYFASQCGSIDGYYAPFIQTDPTLKRLVKNLADGKSRNKLAQMNVALVSEYLRNVGYDIAKPDRHIRRIIGCNAMGISEREIVPEYEAMDIVAEIAKELGWSVAKTDYILWSYCAKGYGEVCTKKYHKENCARCVVQCCTKKQNKGC